MSDTEEKSHGSRGSFFGRRFARIREINKKYAGHHVTMTPAVKVALFLLRIYLLVLVAILFVKFFTILAGR